jgi:hypothetical protein
LQCHRVDRNIVAKPINECQSSLFPGGVIGTVRAVRKFGGSDNGNTDVNPAIRRFDLFDELKNRTTLPFGCNHETGNRKLVPRRRIPGFAIANNFFDIAAKSRSRIGTSRASSSCLRASAIHSETVRRDGMAEGTTATVRVPFSMMTSSHADTRAMIPARSRAASVSDMRTTAIPR